MDTGWASPGTIISDNTVGTIAWANPNNAKVLNGSYATASGNYETTEYLKATNLGFSIPVDATINGIQVAISRKASGNFGPGGEGEVVKIVKSDGSIGSTNKGVNEYWTTTLEVIYYGGSEDLWGETWSPADINDVDFGTVLSVVIENLVEARVDHVQIKVYYTESGTPEIGVKYALPAFSH